MIEIRIALQPKQKRFLQAVEETPITFYGGAKGGGKSRGMRDILLLRRLKYPKTHAGLFRRSYKELEGNHIRPLFENYPVLRNYWNDSKKILKLPNGSTLEFCHCKTDADIELYQGREYNDLGIEEAGQWKESAFKTLLGSNRSSTPGIKPRCLLTGNPGGIGHGWLKRIFIKREFKDKERAEDFTFVKALVEDNQALMENDPDYVNRLESNPNEGLRRAYRYGDWDIHAGQFFSEINREVHLIKPFQIPEHWTRFGAYDYGFNHPGAFGWFTCDEDGNVYLYREFAKAQLRIDQYAAELNKYPDTEKLDYVKAGHDCWVTKGVLKFSTAPTIAEEFTEHDITISKATIDRLQGAAHVRKFLAWQNRSVAGKVQDGKPRFYLFDTCPLSFETLSRMQTDPDRVEDVLKEDAVDGDPTTGDDLYDMIRYGLMSRPSPAEPIPAVIAHKSKEWFDREAKRLEEDIDRQAQAQLAQEHEDDMYVVAETDNDLDGMKHYLNKRRSA